MAIKLAFSTVACPDWPLSQVVEQAQKMGYEGVELRTMGPSSAGLASDPALGDPQKTATVFEDARIQPVVLSTSLALHHGDGEEKNRTTVQFLRDLDLAAAIGCPYVRVFGDEVAPGESRDAVMQRIADRVYTLADEAGKRGVQILFENAGSFAKAKHWWWLFNLRSHPLVGMCWNVANAAAAGEPSSVSVPMLNLRINLAKVKDTQVGEGTGFVPLGEGDVAIEPFITRLLGIGYDGFVTVEWDRIWLPSLTLAQEYLPDAYQRLRTMLDGIAEREEQGRKVTAKAVKRNAPKPPIVFASK